MHLVWSLLRALSGDRVKLLSCPIWSGSILYFYSFQEVFVQISILRLIRIAICLSLLCWWDSFLNLTIIRILRRWLIRLHDILIGGRIYNLGKISLSAHFGPLWVALIGRREVLLRVSRHLVQTIGLRLHVIRWNGSVIIVVKSRLHLPGRTIVAHRTASFGLAEHTIDTVLRGSLLPLLHFPAILVNLWIALQNFNRCTTIINFRFSCFLGSNLLFINSASRGGNIVVQSRICSDANLAFWRS